MARRIRPPMGRFERCWRGRMWKRAPSIKAGPLLEQYPLPLSSGDPLFASLVFPRYLFLRGVVLEQAGKRDEARKNFELYSKYGGGNNLALRSDGFVFPGLVGVALIAVLNAVVQVKVGGGAQTFVVEAGQAEAFL